MSFLGLQNAPYLSINVADVSCQNLVASNGVSLGGDVNIAGELSIGTSPNSYIFPFNNRPTQGQVLAATDGNGDLGWVTIGSGGGGIIGITNTDGNLTTSEANNIVTINLADTVDVPTVISDQIQVGTEYTLPKTAGPTGYVLSANGLGGLCQWQSAGAGGMTGVSSIFSSDGNVLVSNPTGDVDITITSTPTFSGLILGSAPETQYIFPSTYGATGTYLSSDGVGHLQWSSPTGSSGQSLTGGNNITIVNDAINLNSTIPQLQINQLSVGTNGLSGSAYIFPPYVEPSQAGYVLGNVGAGNLGFIPMSGGGGTGAVNSVIGGNNINITGTISNPIVNLDTNVTIPNLTVGTTNSGIGEYSYSFPQYAVSSQDTYMLAYNNGDKTLEFVPQPATQNIVTNLNYFNDAQTFATAVNSSASAGYNAVIAPIVVPSGLTYDLVIDSYTNSKFYCPSNYCTIQSDVLVTNLSSSITFEGIIFSGLNTFNMTGDCFFERCQFLGTSTFNGNSQCIFNNCVFNAGSSFQTLSGTQPNVLIFQTCDCYGLSITTFTGGEDYLFFLTCSGVPTSVFNADTGAGAILYASNTSSDPYTTYTTKSRTFDLALGNYNVSNTIGPTGYVLTSNGTDAIWEPQTGGVTGSIANITTTNTNLLLTNPAGPTTNITLNSNLVGISTINSASLTTSTLNMGSAYKLINAAPIGTGSVMTCDSAGGNIYWSQPSFGTGPTGPTGSNGSNGQNGNDGATGPTGSNGQNGNDGSTGPTGNNGNDGSIGPTGPAGSGSGTISNITTTNTNLTITNPAGPTTNITMNSNLVGIASLSATSLTAPTINVGTAFKIINAAPVGTGSVMTCDTAGGNIYWSIPSGGGLTSNTLYVNDNINDIQTAVNSAANGTAIYMSAGSFGGSTVTMTGKSNINIICPFGQGTICELASRGMTIDNTNTTISISNLQFGASSNLSANSGKYERCNFTGTSTITFGTNSSGFIIVENCDFASTCTVVVDPTFASAIYFINTNFGGCTLSFLQSSATQVIIENCVGLTTFSPNKATVLAYNALVNGQSQANATNVVTNSLSVNNLVYPTPAIANTVLGYNGTTLNWVAQGSTGGTGGGISTIAVGNGNLLVSNPTGPTSTLTLSSNLSGLSSLDSAQITCSGFHLGTQYSLPLFGPTGTNQVLTCDGVGQVAYWSSPTGGAGGSTTITAENSSIVVSPTGTNAYTIGANVVYYNIQNINTEAELAVWFATTEVDGGNTELAPINLSGYYSISQWTNSYINSSAGETIWGGILTINQCGNLTINNMTFNNSVTVSDITGNIYFNDCIFHNSNSGIPMEITLNVNSSTPCVVFFDNCVFEGGYKINSIYSLPNNNNTLSFFNCDFGSSTIQQNNGNATFNSCVGVPQATMEIAGNQTINTVVYGRNQTTTNSINTQALQIGAYGMTGYAMPTSKGAINTAIVVDGIGEVVWGSFNPIVSNYIDLNTIFDAGTSNNQVITVGSYLSGTVGETALIIKDSNNVTFNSIANQCYIGQTVTCIDSPNYNISNLILTGFETDWTQPDTPPASGGNCYVTNCQFNNATIGVVRAQDTATTLTFESCQFQNCTFNISSTVVDVGKAVQIYFINCNFNPSNGTNTTVFNYPDPNPLYPIATSCINIPLNSGLIIQVTDTITWTAPSTLSFSTGTLAQSGGVPCTLNFVRVGYQVSFNVNFGTGYDFLTFKPVTETKEALFIQQNIPSTFLPTVRSPQNPPTADNLIQLGMTFSVVGGPDYTYSIMNTLPFQWTLANNGIIYGSNVGNYNYVTTSIFCPCIQNFNQMGSGNWADYSPCNFSGSYSLYGLI